MRRLTILLFATVGMVWCAAHAQEVSGTAIEEGNHAALYAAMDRVRPALVRIQVVWTDYAEGRELKYDTSGSGVIVTPQGHVVTNHHVAGHAARLFCTLLDKEEIEADLVGTDPLSDISVIKLRGDASRTFPMAAFGDSSRVAVGDTVFAMGSPLALSQSVTRGIVSNVEMIMPEWLRAWGEFKEDGEDVGALVKWIGHDASIAPGNSGGPLVNAAGEVIGINEISMGLSGAIPSNLVKDVSEQIIAGGKVVRAWLGVTVQPRLKHAAADRGVLISGVIEESPAARAGIRSGDLVVRVNGAETNVRFAEQIPDFNRLVAALPIGAPAELVVLREGRELALTVTPEEREPAKLKDHEIKAWGFVASDLSLVQAKEMKRKNRDGVLIRSVRPGGGAGDAKPAIRDKDVLVEVDGQPVRNVAELIAMTEQITAGKTEPTPVLAAFDRKTERNVTVVRVGIKNLEDPGLEVKKAWLPCETQVLTRDIAERIGRGELTGFRVTQVYAGAEAAAAGLQVGDIITSVDDTPLTASAPEHYEELPALIRQYRVGDMATLRVLRGSEEKAIPVVLPRAPKVVREMKEWRDEQFELSVRDISFFDKAREQWKDDQQGVLVSEVKPGGWAALGRLNVGDLIVEMNGAAVADVETFRSQMRAITEEKPKSVVLRVVRGIYTLYIEIEPKWDGN